ncbi:MAG: hypothetical protein PVH25_02575 [Burkholderiales bacterium]|jgi:hypothetical protein
MLILGQEIPLKANLLTALRRHPILWSILLITAMLDFATTMGFMTRYGIHVEQNMVVRWLALNLGMVPGVLAGKFLQIIAAAVFCSLSVKYARAVLLAIVGINLFAILVNFFLVPRLPV